MLFPQPFSIFHLLGMIAIISSLVFVWRFYAFRKKILKKLYTTPSILVAGVKSSGKTSFIKAIAGNVTTNPFKDSFLLAYLENENVQFVELPYFPNSTEKIAEFNKLNLISLIYIFDASKNAVQIDDQIKYFENLKKNFSSISTIIVTNKIDDADEEKLKKLESNFENVHKVCLLDSFLSSPKDMNIKKEIEDLTFLIQSLLNEIKMQREVDAVSRLQ